MNVIKNKEEFANLIKYEKEVYFKFTASWCDPCKRIQPTLNVLSKKHTICSIDVDEMSELADEYNIQSMPTILRFKNGICQDEKCTGSDIEKLQKFFIQDS